MVNGKTPCYLNDILPDQFRNIHQYRTRSANNFPSVPCRTTYHMKSFLPSTVRLWNSLPPDIKNAGSIAPLKAFLKINHSIPNYYYAGSRLGQIYHARIRTESSSLRDHLYQKNLESDPFCKCKQIETSEHFLLNCPNYHRTREALFVNLVGTLNIDTLLYGDPNITDIDNKKNFLIVQDYILKTKRFT
ncbi:Hypothetical predicted protein [Mytilus galloprovincialis]|uniref:Reverse transcriptase zinc-binding domain-containing protein n=1 Tax=Mytilus galloprovincialis TaxID=29158 RepID=A0A8B6FK07_MYTGA|nr:Hypothetical predicted protein [Mytilus galloprovincialis]